VFEGVVAVVVAGAAVGVAGAAVGAVAGGVPAGALFTGSPPAALGAMSAAGGVEPGLPPILDQNTTTTPTRSASPPRPITAGSSDDFGALERHDAVARGACDCRAMSRPSFDCAGAKTSVRRPWGEPTDKR
jgi:hypothetical protein